MLMMILLFRLLAYIRIVNNNVENPQPGLSNKINNQPGRPVNDAFVVRDIFKAYFASTTERIENSD